jgi:hypothetical protein
MTLECPLLHSGAVRALLFLPGFLIRSEMQRAALRAGLRRTAPWAKRFRRQHNAIKR